MTLMNLNSDDSFRRIDDDLELTNRHNNTIRNKSKSVNNYLPKQKYNIMKYILIILFVGLCGFSIFLYFSIKHHEINYCKKNYEKTTLFNVTENYIITAEKKNFVVWCESKSHNYGHCNYYQDEFLFYDEADNYGKTNCYNYTTQGYYRKQKCYIKKTCVTTKNFYWKKFMSENAGLFCFGFIEYVPICIFILSSLMKMENDKIDIENKKNSRTHGDILYMTQSPLH